MLFFFFNDTATTEIYTLSLHDALPIFEHRSVELAERAGQRRVAQGGEAEGLAEVAVEVAELRRALDRRRGQLDRESTPLNSSHPNISDFLLFFEKKKIFLSETVLELTI